MWIKEIVEDLITKYDSNNPYEIAEAKNIHIFQHNLHKEIFGFYKYVRRNKFICINSNLDYMRKHYTCAHELGHSELHSRLNTPFLRANTLFSIDRIEKEANRFAVELLLPDIILSEYIDTNLSIDEISEMHSVPRELAFLKKF